MLVVSNCLRPCGYVTPAYRRGRARTARVESGTPCIPDCVDATERWDRGTLWDGTEVGLVKVHGERLAGGVAEENLG